MRLGASPGTSGGGSPPDCPGHQTWRFARGSSIDRHRCSCHFGSRIRRTNPTASSARHVRGLVARVDDGQVDVDHRLGGEARDAGRADVLQSEDSISEGVTDPSGQRLEHGRPGRVVVDHGDRRRRRWPADPRVVVGIDVFVPRDLLVRRHDRAPPRSAVEILGVLLARPLDPSRRGADRRTSEPAVPAGSPDCRLRMVSTAASTDGRGRNESLPIDSPSSNSHHGAHPAVRSATGGVDACLRATSACSTRSARTGPLRGRSRSNANSSVVIPNGGFATTRYGSFGSASRRTSVSITRTPSPAPTVSTVDRASAGPTPDRVRSPRRVRRRRRSDASARPSRHRPRRRARRVRVRASRRTA